MPDSPRPGSFVAIAILFEGALFLVALGLGALLGEPALAELSMSVNALGWGVVACFPLLGLTWLSLESDWAPFVSLRETVRTKVVPMFSRSTLLDFAVISILAGVGEEALFRGVLHMFVRDTVNIWIAVLAVSVLFGVLHFVSLAYAVITMLIGVYLAGLLIVFDNLFVPMVTHATYDFLALTILMNSRLAQTAEQQEPPGS